jgi:hypothetical protein
MEQVVAALKQVTVKPSESNQAASKHRKQGEGTSNAG